MTLTLPQVDAAARHALQNNRPKLAYRLSEGLLEADPKNGRAHYYQAAALAGMKDFRQGRKSAARAYRLSNSDQQRYEAAQLAAKLSFADERLTISQLWLRRAVQYAPSEVSREQSVLAFRKVRQKNPLNFQFRFSVTPSDNVNNGANSPFNIIDGVPVVGRLSAGAQALSGMVTSASFSGSYRIFEAEGHETRLTGRVQARQVSLNNSIPGLSGNDISSSTAQVGVGHFLFSRDQSAFWRFDVKGGRSWYGGDPLYDFVSLGVQRSQRAGKNIRLTFGGDIEQQYDQTAASFDTTVIKAFTSARYIFEGGSNVGLFVQFRDADSDDVNRTSQQWTAIASYKPGRRIGPAEMAFSLGYSTLDYDNYRIIAPVPGGREDTSTFGSISATFKDWSYMGFVPTLSLRAEKSRSNISRFDVDETSITVGIRSEF